LAEPLMPAWDKSQALTTLSIVEIPFDHLDGNCLGFARDRSIAINPVNSLPHKTTFHELAHVLLGHTSEGSQADSEQTPRNLRECEAEAVALLCCAASICLAWSSHAATFKRGGAQAIPSPNAGHNES
jgi:Zn-dependent peptidase ImmA (M78 family)